MALDTVAARGKRRKLPIVDPPVVADDQLRRNLEAIREHLRMYEGDSGAPKERFITIEELEKTGLIGTKIQQGYALIDSVGGNPVSQGQQSGESGGTVIINEGDTITGSSTLAGLSDTSVGAAQAGDFLQFNGGVWTPSSITGDDQDWTGKPNFIDCIRISGIDTGYVDFQHDNTDLNITGDVESDINLIDLNINLQSNFGIEWDGVPLLFFEGGSESDPYLTETTVVANFVGSDGDTSYIDGNGTAYTFLGDSQISSSQFFSAPTSIYTGSGTSGNYVEANDNEIAKMGNSDFTIECHVYPLDDDLGPIMGLAQSAANKTWRFWMGTNNNAQALVSDSGAMTAHLLSAGVNTVNENTWTHLALVRKGVTLYWFRQGVLMDTATMSSAAATIYEDGLEPTGDFRLGSTNNSINYLNGYIDNLRITRGTARYVASFTAPAPGTLYTEPTGQVFTVGDANFVTHMDSQLTLFNSGIGINWGSTTSSKEFLVVENLVAGGTPPIDDDLASVTMLLTGEGSADEAVSVSSDIGGHGFVAVTAGGGIAEVTADQSKFGNRSLRVDDTTGGVEASFEAPSSTDFDFGSGDFTVEFDFRTPEGSGSMRTIMGTWIFTERRFICGIHTVTPGDFRSSFNWSTTGSNSVGGTQHNWSATTGDAGSYNTWYHIAYSRVGNTLYIFVDGEEIGTEDMTGVTINASNEVFAILGDGNGGPAFEAFMDNIRITKGVGRYSTDFTPPTTAYQGTNGDETFYVGDPTTATQIDGDTLIPLTLEVQGQADFTTVRMKDATEAAYVDFSHDTTDFLSAFTATTDWDITGLAGFNVSNYRFDVDQTLTASEDNYVLTYDDTLGTLQFESLPPAIQGLGPWRYRTETATPPASGQIRFDNADISSATEFYLHETNDNGTDVSSFMDLLVVDGSILYLQTASDSTKYVLIECGAVVDSGVYRTVAIANVLEGSGGEPAQNETVLVIATTPALAAGGVTAAGTPVDNQVAVWTGATTIEGTSSFTFDGAELVVGNYTFDVDQTLTATEDNYVLTYDDASGTISFEAAGGGGGGGATPLNIIGDINMATPPVTAAFTALLQFLDNDETDTVGSFGYNADGDIRISNFVTNSTLEVYGDNSSGTHLELARFWGGTTTTDYVKGPTLFLENLRVGSNGRTFAFSEEDPPFRVTDGPLGSSGELHDNIAMWGTGQIQAYSSGLTAADLSLNSQGGVIGMSGADSISLGHDNSLIAITTSTGMTVRNASATQPNTGTVGGQAEWQLASSNGVMIAEFGIETATDTAYLHHEIHGQDWVISAQNAGGANRDIAYFNAETGTRFNEPNVENEVARTATMANGGFEVNNTVTGAGFERVLTVGDYDAILPPVSADAMIYSDGTDWINSKISGLTWDTTRMNFLNGKKISWTDGLAVETDVMEMTAAYTDGDTADVELDRQTGTFSTASTTYVDVTNASIDHANLVTGEDYLLVVSAIVGSSSTSNEDNYVRVEDEAGVLAVGSEANYEASTASSTSGGVYFYCTSFTAAASGTHNVQARNSSGGATTYVNSCQIFCINIDDLGAAYSGNASTTSQSAAGVNNWVGAQAGITIGNGVDDYLVFHTNNNNKATGAPAIGSAFWDGTTVYGPSHRDTDSSAGDEVQGGAFLAQQLPAGTYYPAFHASSASCNSVEIHAINLSRLKEYYAKVDLTTTNPASGTEYDYMTDQFTVVNAGDWFALCGMSYEHIGAAGRNRVEWDVNTAGATIVAGDTTLGGGADDASLLPPGHFVPSFPRAAQTLAATDVVDVTFKLLPGASTPTGHEVTDGWHVAFLPIEKVYVDDTLSIGDPGIAMQLDATGIDIPAATADVTMNANSIIEPVLQDHAVANTASEPTGTTETLSYPDGPSFEVDLESVTGNITITLSNAPVSGTYGRMVVKVTQDSAVARTITWAGGTFRWDGGSAHVMTTTLDGISIYTFETWDGGTTWDATGRDSS